MKQNLQCQTKRLSPSELFKFEDPTITVSAISTDVANRTVVKAETNAIKTSSTMN